MREDSCRPAHFISIFIKLSIVAARGNSPSVRAGKSAIRGGNDRERSTARRVADAWQKRIVR